jgi:peptide deformylase
MQLVTYPNTVLTVQANDWQFVSEEDFINAAKIEEEMLVLMKQSNGIGLAANQVGLLSRVFVMQTQDGREFGLFNPVVKFESEVLEDREEGCLSFPDLWIDVKRPVAIDVEYLDKNGKECKMSFVGQDARVFLHELDHLNGVCFTDKISKLKLALAKKRQSKKRKYNGRTK